MRSSGSSSPSLVRASAGAMRRFSCQRRNRRASDDDVVVEQLLLPRSRIGPDGRKRLPRAGATEVFADERDVDHSVHQRCVDFGSHGRLLTVRRRPERIAVVAREREAHVDQRGPVFLRPELVERTAECGVARLRQLRMEMLLRAVAGGRQQRLAVGRSQPRRAPAVAPDAVEDARHAVTGSPPTRRPACCSQRRSWSPPSRRERCRRETADNRTASARRQTGRRCP